MKPVNETAITRLATTAVPESPGTVKFAPVILNPAGGDPLNAKVALVAASPVGGVCMSVFKSKGLSP